MAYMVMAHMVMAYIYIVMAYMVMSDTVMAYIVMACMVMAYMVMAQVSPFDQLSLATDAEVPSAWHTVLHCSAAQGTRRPQLSRQAMGRQATGGRRQAIGNR